jgi:hypothetical protein
MARAKKQPAPEAEPLPLRLEWRSPAELAENPANWRTHPEAQVAALTDVIAEVGWAGACLYNERTGRLIDGHARRKVALEKAIPLVPVLVGDWSEEQEKTILATLDPLSALAEADAAKLDALLREVETDPANDPAAEWQGMPGFEQEEKSGITVHVHFETQADMEAFETLIGGKVTRSSMSVWYPYRATEPHGILT